MEAVAALAAAAHSHQGEPVGLVVAVGLVAVGLVAVAMAAVLMEGSTGLMSRWFPPDCQDHIQ